MIAENMENCKKNNNKQRNKIYFELFQSLQPCPLNPDTALNPSKNPLLYLTSKCLITIIIIIIINYHHMLSIILIKKRFNINELSMRGENK